MEKMTIHKALAELKLIDKKLDSAIELFKPCYIQQGEKKLSGTVSVEEFNKTAIADKDSIEALMKRKMAIKCAIIASNAKTIVNIGGNAYTVAEAINKKSIYSIEEKYIGRMKIQLRNITAELNKLNNSVQDNLQALLEKSFGKDNTKVSKDDVEAISKPFLTMNEWKFVDPLKISDYIVSLENQSLTFYTNVDAALSESNALTSIEI